MGEGKNEKTPVALYFRPAWQTGLTPFDQLYVLLFPPMKMRCDRVLWGYFTRGRDGVGQVKARNVSIVTFIVRVFYRIFLQVPKHIYSCLWSLILSVRSFVKCSVLYYVVCSNGVSNFKWLKFTKPFRHVHQQSKYCWSCCFQAARTKLVLVCIVHTVVFCILQLRSASVKGIKKRCHADRAKFNSAYYHLRHMALSPNGTKYIYSLVG